MTITYLLAGISAVILLVSVFHLVLTKVSWSFAAGWIISSLYGVMQIWAIAGLGAAAFLLVPDKVDGKGWLSSVPLNQAYLGAFGNSRIPFEIGLGVLLVISLATAICLLIASGRLLDRWLFSTDDDKATYKKVNQNGLAWVQRLFSRKKVAND